MPLPSAVLRRLEEGGEARVNPEEIEMKIHSAGLALAFFLFGAGSLARAQAAPAVPADALAPSAEVAAPASCAGDSLALALAAFTPEPKVQSSLPCGACSLSPCKFATQGTICRNGSIWGHCLDVIGTTCSQDGLPKCSCWVGEIP